MRASAIVPWPLPWSIGVAVAAAVAELAVGVPAAPAAVAAGGAALAAVAARWRSARWRAVALALAVGLLVGGVRGAAAGARPDPWATRVGEAVVVEARVADGVAWPGDGRPGLRLRGGDWADGTYRLEGRLASLPGRRNPGGFDAHAHGRRHGVTAALEVERAVLVGPAPATTRVRAALQAGVVAGLDGPSAALMQALTLGVRDDLGPLRDAFAASGLAHVLALSGLHVGVLAAVLVALVGGVGPWRVGAVIAVLVGYVAVVGAAPAVVRATAMVSVALVGRALGVGGGGWGSHLALAAGASLMVRPAWVGDLGFQLSYLSVLGMGWLATPLARAWSGPPPARGATAGRRSAGRRALARARRWVAASAAVSLSAQAATAPLVASAFGAIPLAAPVANLAAVPLATALVPLGFAAGLAGLLDPALAAWVNHATALVAGALLALARVAAHGPALPWGAVDAVGFAAYALGAFAVVAGVRGLWRPWRAAVLVAAAGATAAFVPPTWRPPDLIVLDVGQGDATVLRVARGQAVLVDGGGTPFGDFDVGARTVVPALRALGVAALPLVVATHPDLDHVEGLAAVLRAFPVGALLVGHPAPEADAFADLMAAAAARGVPVLEGRRGDRYRVGDLELDVLHPATWPRGPPNDDSVALLASWRGDPWALLLGDVPAVVEVELAVPPTPVLLVPHHGSSSSTSAALLAAARPRWALVSVGENRYGHPAPAVLERLWASGATVRTTREEGALRVPYPPP